MSMDNELDPENLKLLDMTELKMCYRAWESEERIAHKRVKKAQKNLVAISREIVDRREE